MEEDSSNGTSFGVEREGEKGDSLSSGWGERVARGWGRKDGSAPAATRGRIILFIYPARAIECGP